MYLETIYFIVKDITICSYTYEATLLYKSLLQFRTLDWTFRQNLTNLFYKCVLCILYLYLIHQGFYGI